MAGLKVLAKTSQKISIGADTFRLKVTVCNSTRVSKYRGEKNSFAGFAPSITAVSGSIVCETIDRLCCAIVLAVDGLGGRQE